MTMNNMADHLVTCPYCRRMFSTGSHDGKGSDILTCSKCSHTWMSRIPDPKRCPKCGTDKWNAEFNTYECKRCGFTWESYKKRQKCPRCASSEWEYDAEAMLKNKDEERFRAILDTDAVKCHDAGMNVVDVALYCDLPLLELLEFYIYKGWQVD